MTDVGRPDLGRSILKTKDVVIMLVAALSVVGSGGIAYGFLRGDVNRISADQIDIKRKVDETHDTTIELRMNQRDTRSQLDRIEVMLGGHPPPDHTNYSAPPAHGPR